MSLKIMIEKETFIYAPPVNEATNRWGVYAIPRMWKLPSGELVVRFNGEQDCSDTKTMFVAENLYFSSLDCGKTWSYIADGEKRYNIRVLQGITSPYLQLKNGHFLAIQDKEFLFPIIGLSSEKSFPVPNQDAIVSAYPYGMIPEKCKGIDLIEYDENGNILERTPVQFDFPEREILINIAALSNGDYIPVEQNIKPFIFKSPYFSALTELPDGTIAAVSYGQHPDVADHFCQEIYFVVSNDKGKTWKKRSTIASEALNLPYGYGGDGNEVSLTQTIDGTLLCAMRMDMSIDPNVATPICDVMVSASHDNGYTWETPTPVADSSVTPQIIALQNHIVVLIYGRPGVHFKVSEDDGKTWSKSYSIIGKTLEEERASGRTDAESKYFDTCSYSNCFVEQIDKDSILVLYNSMQYPEDKTRHKAAYVKKITVKKSL